MTQSEALNYLKFPARAAVLLRKRRTLLKELAKQPKLIPTRVAILGGSTTTEVRNMLELFLLSEGIQPTFYESGYNRFSEDVMLENPALWEFKPEVVFIHTTWRNIRCFPDLMESESDVRELVLREMDRFTSLWEKVHSKLGAIVIQNNFDLPHLRPLANLEAFESYGRVNYLMQLNAEFSAYARKHTFLHINDILYLCAQTGLDEWAGQAYWYNFHMAISPAATVPLAKNVAAIIKSVYGRSKKCLVLDLDNTLWGGVVGDDGVQNLILGRDHPVGEAFLDFQQYVKALQQRGIILAVCSKNDPENAKSGFSHPDCILKCSDFSAFKANWNPKPQNIREIAEELNIGTDSMVFLDDSPAERELVAQELPEVATPDIGSDVSRFAAILEGEHYFDAHRVVREDLGRLAFYNSNARRSSYQTNFYDHGHFLASLEMSADVEPFSPVYLERITQLVNKTNQFNLTTRRYTSAEIESVSRDENHITLYAQLRDKFGDNGLVSVLIGRVRGDSIQINLWLMSCRVLNRELELAMFDALVEHCVARRIRQIIGVYIPTKKNGLVADHYRKLGFTETTSGPEGTKLWSYSIPENPIQLSQHIRRTSHAVSLNVAQAPTEYAVGE